MASLGWGTGGVASRALLLAGVPPFGLVFLRSALATVAVLAFLLLTGRPLPRGLPVWRRGLVLGTANLAAPFLFFTLAVQYVSAGFAALIAALIPAMTAVWAHLLLPDERLRLGKLAGLGIAFAGVALLILAGESGIGPGGRPVLGGLLGLVAVGFASFGGVYGRRHAPSHRVFELAGAQFAVGAVVLAVLAGVVEGPRLPELSGAGWTLIGYLALASSFLPFVLFYWLLQRITATRASLIGYVVPVVGVSAGALFLGEQVTSGIVAGGALILLGVVLVDRIERRVRPLPAAPAT